MPDSIKDLLPHLPFISMMPINSEHPTGYARIGEIMLLIAYFWFDGKDIKDQLRMINVSQSEMVQTQNQQNIQLTALEVKLENITTEVVNIKDIVYLPINSR